MIHIIGSGVVGLTCADLLLSAGCDVRLTTASDGADGSTCSWWAGGMLAPFCEMETAEPLIGELAPASMVYWKRFCAGQPDCDYTENGTLVIAPNRDAAMLAHFAQKTREWQRIDAQTLHELEPNLSQHREGLFFPSEAHIEPRKVLQALWHSVRERAEVTTRQTLSDTDIADLEKSADWVLDCRGYAARESLTNLREVRGEMLHLYCPEVQLSRPVRLLHPRIPIYLVPRTDGQLMLGATMIENASRERASVRSVLELLSAAYAVNPAFSQAEIVEIGVDVRPAYADNLPKIIHRGKRLLINGMYRHGYLLAPAVAEITRNFIINQTNNQIIQHENTI